MIRSALRLMRGICRSHHAHAGNKPFIPGIYHYSNEGETNWFSFAEEIKMRTGSHCRVLPIPSTGFPTPAKRPAYSLMDKTKIKKDYDLCIPVWQSSLAVCIDLLKKNGV